MEAVAYASVTSFATKSLPFSSLSQSSIINLPQICYKNTLKSRSLKKLVICASSGSSSGSVVTLLDYGAGNVRSVRNASRYLGFEIEDYVDWWHSFKDVMICANSKRHFEWRLPYLSWCWGICLSHGCIDQDQYPILAGTLCKLLKTEILDDVGGHHVYFVHSYRAMPSDDNKDWVSSTCNYGDDFIGSIRRGNVHAVQFHPEKSGGKKFELLFSVSVKENINNDKNKIYDIKYQLEYTKIIKSRIARVFVLAYTVDVGLSVLRRFLNPKSPSAKKPTQGQTSKLAKSVRNLGKPVELAGQYYKDGAEEVCLWLGGQFFEHYWIPKLPIRRFTNVAGVKEHIRKCFCPTNSWRWYYSSLEVASEYFRSGADKISIGSDAVYVAEEYIKTKVKTGKSSLKRFSKVYGNQAVVVSIDPRRVPVKCPNDVQFKTKRVTKPGPNGEEYVCWNAKPDRVAIQKMPSGLGVFPKTPNERSSQTSDLDGKENARGEASDLVENGEHISLQFLHILNGLYVPKVNGGREGRPIGAYEVAKIVKELGAGEILLNCIDCDGQGKGFDIDLIKLISDAVSIPVIASSGAGAVEHFSEVFMKTNASAALAAGIFHRKEVPIQSVKARLLKVGIEVRM
ncbi:Imidazole glycerol phosphate synthase subunit HisF [Hibiscus syriacus]|uniref:Imidazole glycerol phosphate synthase subunit HisF n=1 Tax=Hibiscus syriacus TaxID=106335 RepID=A0A6A2ZZY4_HIBSY|nr:Imidazole glycerol phosphate synthase subunit HisF [Hibiscus syriacus]